MQNPPFLSRIGWYLMLIAVLASMLLSASMLLRLGIPYDAPYGPAVAKIHPGTYFLLLAWFMALSGTGNPLRSFIEQMARQRLIGVYFFSMVGVFVWAVFRHGTSGAAFIIDSLWTPAIAAFTIELLDDTRRRRLFQLVMVLLACNAALALGEALSPARLTPLHVGRTDIIEEEYFRSSAFLGHPLHNAQITASLLPAATLLPWGRGWRILLVLVCLLSLLAFGGRTSVAAVVLIYGSYLIVRIGRYALSGRMTYLQLTGGSLAGMLGVTALVGVVAATGLGDRIFNNLSFDSSASVRLRVWDAFHYLSSTDIWFGVAPSEIDLISLRMGLDPTYEAIENFWIYLFMQFGLIGFIPFLVGLVCLLWMLWKNTNTPLKLSIVLYILVASTGNTLASKTVSLMLLTTVILASAVHWRATSVSGRIQ